MIGKAPVLVNEPGTGAFYVHIVFYENHTIFSISPVYEKFPL